MRHCALEVEILKKRDSSGAGGISKSRRASASKNLKDAPPRMSYTHPWRLPRFGDIACSRRPSSGFPPAAGAAVLVPVRVLKTEAISARSLVIPLAYHIKFRPITARTTVTRPEELR